MEDRRKRNSSILQVGYWVRDSPQKIIFCDDVSDVTIFDAKRTLASREQNNSFKRRFLSSRERSLDSERMERIESVMSSF